MFRNPNLVIGGIEPFPDNAYDIDDRHITRVNADYANVEIFIYRYANATKTKLINIKPQIYFTLKNLPNDPAQLNPTLYQIELLSQHGNEIVDGTALNDFILI
jgi:hypothetical protein